MAPSINSAADAGHPAQWNLNSALPGLAALGAIGGAPDAPGSTDTRARSHQRRANLSVSSRQTMPQVSSPAGRRSDGELIPPGVSHRQQRLLHGILEPDDNVWLHDTAAEAENRQADGSSRRRIPKPIRMSEAAESPTSTKLMPAAKACRMASRYCGAMTLLNGKSPSLGRVGVPKLQVRLRRVQRGPSKVKST